MMQHNNVDTMVQYNNVGALLSGAPAQGSSQPVFASLPICLHHFRLICRNPAPKELSSEDLTTVLADVLSG